MSYYKMDEWNEYCSLLKRAGPKILQELQGKQDEKIIKPLPHDLKLNVSRLYCVMAEYGPPNTEMCIKSVCVDEDKAHDIAYNLIGEMSSDPFICEIPVIDWTEAKTKSSIVRPAGAVVMPETPLPNVWMIDAHPSGTGDLSWSHSETICICPYFVVRTPFDFLPVQNRTMPHPACPILQQINFRLISLSINGLL